MNKTTETRMAHVEVRASEDFCLEGVAASYGTTADIGAYLETIAPGAFTQSLRDGADVRCLFNHDKDQVLGRSKSGTLTLRDTAKGLAFRCQLDARNTQHQNVYAMVQRGDISECSFAFAVPDGGDSWSETTDARGKRVPLRTLRNVKLWDVSVVTDPAYKQGTQVDARDTDAAGDAARRELCRKQGEQIDADHRRWAAEQAAQIAGEKP